MLEQVKCTTGVNGDINETTLHSPAWVLTAGLVQQPKVHHGLQNTIFAKYHSAGAEVWDNSFKKHKLPSPRWCRLTKVEGSCISEVMN